MLQLVPFQALMTGTLWAPTDRSSDAGVDFRVWAPRRQRVNVYLPATDQSLPMLPEEDGFFYLLTDAATAGTEYFFRLDDEPVNYPDPASRFQADGVHGASMVVDPHAMTWTDETWQGVELSGGQVIYEL